MARNPNDQLQQARAYLQSGNIVQALELIEALLRKAPRLPEANYLLGVAHLMQGNAAHAVVPLETALKADPHNGPVLDHLGACLLMLNRYADAEAVLRRATSLPRAPAIVFMRLGLALLYQNRARDAVEILQRAVDLAPRDADCQVTLGRALHANAQSDAARATFETAHALAPANPDIAFNLGVIALEQRQLDAAAGWFNRALALAPRHADAWVNLGIVQEQQHNVDAALASYRKALDLDPRLPAAGSNLAHALAALNRHEEARAQYLETLRHAPQFIAAHEGLAGVCLALGRVAEAITHLRATVAAEPANATATLALANALMEVGQLEEAAPLAQRASELNPDAAPAYATRATLLSLRGALADAVQVLEAGYARTDNGVLLGMLANHYRQLCDWPKWERAWAGLAPRVDQESALGSPFWLLSQPITARQQRLYTEAWAAARYKNIRALPPRAARASHERLRIGYLSSDFQEHPAAYLIADVLEHHDRARFEIYAYSYGPSHDASAMRQRIRAACEHFVDIAWDTDDAAAQRIRDDEIDILIELKGYTVGDRIPIMARRPCDIQVTWLGYPGTTGAAFIDYLIADPYIIRPGEESTCTERVLRMPHCYQPNDRKRVVPPPLSRREYGLPEEGVVFCCFNQTYKITPDVFRVWMRLLQRMPGSVLWLVDSAATPNLRQAVCAHGVEAGRVVFAPRCPYAEHLARYRVADLALDTFPYTSHTTASDALWCDCPTVGLVGDTFAARVSGSILAAAGVDELICATLDDYEALALRLALDRDALRELRAKIARAREHAPLFDSRQFARDLERLYEQIIEERNAKV